jgi:hypothetical protein
MEKLIMLKLFSYSLLYSWTHIAYHCRAFKIRVFAARSPFSPGHIMISNHWSPSQWRWNVPSLLLQLVMCLMWALGKGYVLPLQEPCNRKQLHS